VKEQADVKAVKNSVKGLPFDQWAEQLRKTFNNDSIIRIRVEKGIFKQGDNKLVDREVFKQKVEVPQTKGYPIDAVFGKKLSAPKEFDDVRGLVTADYQDALEKEWIAQLRKKYPVTVYKEVLATVNKH
jgi:peptidyl-prolyl cis-trans isomerase SurA